MATKKVGTLVKEARTAAGLTQEQLARKLKGVEANDISRLERGEVDFTQEQLKTIAKACGVTQKSLLDAPKNLGKAASSSSKKSTSSSSSASAKKTTSASSSSKSSTSKASSSKTSSSKSTSSSSKATSSSSKSSSSSSGTSMKVSAAEKKLVELYREADSDTKKLVTSILKGEQQASQGGRSGGFKGAEPERLPNGPGDFFGAVVAGAVDAVVKGL